MKITAKQASEIMGCKLSHIYNLINSGKLDAERVYNRIVVDEDHVRRFIAFEKEVRLKWMPARRYAKWKKICINTVRNWIDKGILDSAIKDGVLYVRKDQGKRC